MSTARQRRRGTTAQHVAFTGLVGEITIDTDKKVVVVHDGVTPGGNPLAAASSASGVEVQTHAATSKPTPVDADEIPIVDSAASNGLKKLTWANLKTAAGSAVFTAWGSLVNAATGKTTPVDADAIDLMDSASSNATKKLTWANLKATMFAAWGSLIATGTGKTTPIDADVLAFMDSAASNATKVLTWANLKATLKTYFDSLYLGFGGGTLTGVIVANVGVSLATGATTPAQGQIAFPAAQNASAGANTLDDYEEGTFTPTFVSAGATFNYTTQTGVYTKIGNRVVGEILITLAGSGNTLTAAALTIAGLPFTCNSAFNPPTPLAWVNFATAFVLCQGSIIAGGTTISLTGITVAAVSSNTSLQSNHMSPTLGTQVRLSFEYVTT